MSENKRICTRCGVSYGFNPNSCHAWGKFYGRHKFETMETNQEEMAAAKKAYEAGLGASEFEAFMDKDTPQKENWEKEFTDLFISRGAQPQDGAYFGSNVRPERVINFILQTIKAEREKEKLKSKVEYDRRIDAILEEAAAEREKAYQIGYSDRENTPITNEQFERLTRQAKVETIKSISEWLEKYDMHYEARVEIERLRDYLTTLNN